MLDAGHVVIGTPDDAVDVLKKLQAKQGEFGAFLHQAHDWANWENTKRSYELYIRYVAPHFNGTNANREKSYDNWKENSVAFSSKMGAAAKATLEKYGATAGLEDRRQGRLKPSLLRHCVKIGHCGITKNTATRSGA
jgi:limonene 1,2-monooxygenase